VKRNHNWHKPHRCWCEEFLHGLGIQRGDGHLESLSMPFSKMKNVALNASKGPDGSARVDLNGRAWVSI